jgi:hypothetical protein
VDLKQKTAMVTDLMKETKRSWIASEPESTDMAIYLHFWRDDELVVMLQCRYDQEVSSNALLVGVAGFGATTVSMTIESYNTRQLVSPVTGEAWMSGELQYVFETNPQNKVEGWVTEALITYVAERGGGWAKCSDPYRMENHEVFWEDQVIEMGTEVEPENDVIGFMQHVLSLRTIEDQLREDSEHNAMTALVNSLVTDPELRFFHTDMATYRTLTDRNLITAIGFQTEKGSVRAQLIKERMGDHVILGEEQDA